MLQLMLKEQDDSFYRIEKSYTVAAENDGMTQGYNGLSAYMSTNPSSLVAYHKMYGLQTLSANFVDFNIDDYIRSSLLGTEVSDHWKPDTMHLRRYIHLWERPVADQSLKITMHFHSDICMIKNGVSEEAKRNVRT